MSGDRKPLISGNWKMNHNHFEAIQTVQKLAYAIEKDDYEACDVSVHPPFTDLRSVQTVLQADNIPVSLGAQNVHEAEKGAFTGEVSAGMLDKLDVKYVIVDAKNGLANRLRALASGMSVAAAAHKADATGSKAIGETGRVDVVKRRPRCSQPRFERQAEPLTRLPVAKHRTVRSAKRRVKWERGKVVRGRAAELAEHEAVGRDVRVIQLEA